MPGSYTPPVVVEGGGGGGGGVVGLSAVKNDGTDVVSGGSADMAFVEWTAGGGVDASVATLAGGALTVVSDGIVFIFGDFGPNTAPPAADGTVFQVMKNADTTPVALVSLPLASGSWDLPIPVQIAKVAAGDVITAQVFYAESPDNNFYFTLSFAFVG